MLDKRCTACLAPPGGAAGPSGTESELAAVVAREGGAVRRAGALMVLGGVAERECACAKRGEADGEGRCAALPGRGRACGVEMARPVPVPGMGAEGRRPGEEKGAAARAAVEEEMEAVEVRGRRAEETAAEGVGSGRTICEQEAASALRVSETCSTTRELDRRAQGSLDDGPRASESRRRT